MEEKNEYKDDYTDPILNDVIQYIAERQAVSACLIQRKFSVGYTRAVKILNQLEQEGLIGPNKKGNGLEVYIAPVKIPSAEQEEDSGIPRFIVTGHEFVRILKKEVCVDIRICDRECLLLEKGNTFEFFFKKDLVVRARVLNKTVATRLEDFPEEIFVKAGLGDFHITERYNYIYQKFTPEKIDRNRLVAIEFEIIP